MAAGKKTILIAVPLAIVIAAALVLYIIFAPRSGFSPGASLRDYLGKQIVGVVNAHLVPSLDFDTIDYQAPDTVRLTGARLVSSDGVDVFDIDSLVVTLAEVPSLNRPIRISQVLINGGRINLISDPKTGRFRGLSPIVKPSIKSGSEEVPDEFKLSNVLKLEQIKLRDLAVQYDDGSGEPMTITGFGADLDVQPSSEGESWYDLALKAGREPGLTLDLNGSFNIDTFLARLVNSTCEITINEQTASSLPPQIQSVISELDATGHTRVTIDGTIDLQQPAASELSSGIHLDGFNIARGDYRLLISQFDGRLDLANGVATLHDAVAKTLGGQSTIDGKVHLQSEGLPVQVSWTLSDIELREALRGGMQAGKQPKLAGITNGTGSATTSLQAPLDNIDGSGELHVRHGRLLVLPGLVQLLQKIGNLALTDDKSFEHRADANFSLQPQGVLITRSEIVTGLMAARATGTVSYDGSLDLKVNAGPLEKLQSMLGKVGDIFGKISDRLVTYRVKGPVSKPTVTVEPLGIGG